MEQAVAVANYFVDKSLQEVDSQFLLTNMKLVKLVYIAHGWFLGLHGRPLISELPQAWKYGPVVPSVYNAFKSSGNQQITRPYTALIVGQPDPYQLSDDPEVKALLDRVWSLYKSYTAFQLSSMTHQEGTPWFETWHNQGGKFERSVPIMNGLIEKHYRHKLLQNSNA